MDNKDWQEILHMIGLQKNVALGVLDDSRYGSDVYYHSKGFVKGLEMAEQYIISRLGKGGKKND